jgi:Histidine kinase-, DNA gyrase B-, and HSP90-like ATPase
MLRPTVTTAQLDSDPGLLRTLQYSIAKSILTSYSGDFDWLAEVVQNSIDALQRRWAEGDFHVPRPEPEAQVFEVLPDDAVPRLRIVIYRTQNRVVVVDNGIGMSLRQFARLATPFATDKPPATERGQKGVGLKYLIYGHNHFGVASKPAPTGETVHDDDPFFSELEGQAAAAGMSDRNFGFASAAKTRQLIDSTNLPATADTPEFPGLDFSDDLLRCLEHVDAGTVVALVLDSDSEHGDLARRQFSQQISRWEHVIRTKTAIGNVAIAEDMQRLMGQPVSRSPQSAWLDHLVVDIFVAEGEGPPYQVTPRQVRPEFEYPHILVPPGEVARARDLRSSTSTAQYEVLYESWDRAEFESDFGTYLDEREARLPGVETDSAAAEREEIQLVRNQVGQLGPEVYAAYGYHNRYWENRASRRVRGVDERSPTGRQPDDLRAVPRVGFESSFRGGVLIAGLGMPMAHTLQHPIEILPQDNDRLFVLLSLGGKLQLDLGRKVPHATDHAAFIRYVDDFVEAHYTAGSRLILSRNLRRAQTPQGIDVEDQLQRVLDRVRTLEQLTVSPRPSLASLFPRRAHLWPELEVEAVFLKWLADGLVPGLRVRAVVGGVSPLDLMLEAQSIDLNSIGAFPADLLPADPETPAKNPVWAESKVLLSDLVKELLDVRRPGKSLEYIDLAVVRDLDVLRLRSRLADNEADAVLSNSDLAADDAGITVGQTQVSPSGSGTSVRLDTIEPTRRSYAGTTYMLTDQDGNFCEVFVLEELISVLDPLVT